MINESAEVKALSALLDPIYLDWIDRMDIEYFTDVRRSTFLAMRKAYSQYGEITPEGIERFYPQFPKEILVSSVGALEPVLESLQEAYTRRQLLTIAEKIRAAANADNPSLLDIQDMVTEVYNGDRDTTLTVASMKFLEEVELRERKEYNFISTGFNFLDIMMGGEWPRKEVSIITADPGGSKTSLVCCSMRKMAENGHGSLFFSLEMAKEQLIMRWICDMCGIDSNDIKRGAITPQQKVEINIATNHLRTLPMHVVDDSDLSITEMVPLIRRYVKMHDIKTVFIDYLQIIKLDTDDKNRGLGKVTKVLKSIAKQLNIHICVISQKTGGKEGVWVIRDSGDVPANIDILISLRSEQRGEDQSSVSVEFIKNRNGKLGAIPAIFDGRYYRYVTG